MRRFYLLVVKEVKELVRDRYVLFSVILAPLLIFPLILGISYIVLREAGGVLEEAVRGLPHNVAVVLEDPGDEIAVEVARRLGVRVEGSVSEALAKYSVVVVLRSNFSESILEGKPAMVTVTSKVERLYNMLEIAVVSTVASMLREITSSVLVEKLNIDPRLIKTPVVVESRILYRGELIKESRLVALYASSIGLAFAIFILGILALQVGTISIGVEREARTLELLLTLPLSRFELIAGKVLGVSVISLMGFTSFLVGLAISMLLALLLIPPEFVEVRGTPQTTPPISPLGLIEVLRTLPVASVIAIVACIAVAMILTTLLGVLVGIILAGDIRGALTSGSYVALILAIPLIVETMGTSPPTPLQIAFLASPMYPPFKTAQMIVFGETGLSIAYAIATLANATLLMLLAVLMVKSERLIYGVRIRRPRSPEI